MKTFAFILITVITGFSVTIHDWGYCDSPAAGMVGGSNNWYGVHYTPPADCTTGTISQIEMWCGATTGYTNADVRLRIFKFLPSMTNPITEAWSGNYNFDIPDTGPTGNWVTFNLSTPFAYVRSVSPDFLVAFQSEHAPSQPTWVSKIGYDGTLGTPNRNWRAVNVNMPAPSDWAISPQGDYMFRLTFTYTPQLTPVLPTSLGNIKAVYNQ